MNNSFITTNVPFVKIKNRRINIKSEKEPTDFSQIELKYIKKAKNIILTFLYKGNKIDKAPGEMHFYIRYIDGNNYIKFSLRNGNEIKYCMIQSGKIIMQTSYTKISNDNLFCQKFNLALSTFEESFTVLIDGVMVMNIEHLSENTGDFFIKIDNDENNSLDFVFENFIISENILAFEPIIKMNKNPTAYFMQGNDFYEQDAYEIALYYYKKGVLYGTGDDKIYNRIGNLQFLIENYPSAEFYYKLSLDQKPDNDEYKFNYTRSLVKQNKYPEFIELINNFISQNKFSFELFIDYAGYLIQRKEWSEALKTLELIKPNNEENTAFNTKYGRVLIELGNIDAGQQLLFESALKLKEKDPSSSIILLNYSLEKRIHIDSLKLITKILYDAEEYNEIKEIFTNIRNEITFDNELLNIYLNVMQITKLYNTVWQEIDKLDENQITSEILLLKAESGINLKKFEEVELIINQLYNNEEFAKININRLAILIFKLAGFTKKTPVNMSSIYEKADKTSSDFIDVQKEYAKFLVDLTEYDDALPILESLLKSSPDDIEIQYNTGIALDGIGDWEQARLYLHKVYLATDDPSVGFIFAHTLYYSKMFQDALNIITKHYNSLPDDGKKDNLIGNIYLSMEDIIEAQRFYYLALEKDKDNEEFALNLAESFYKMQDYENAFMLTRQLIKPESFDRAKILHIKLKEHLFFSVNCSVCNEQWQINKALFNKENIIEIENKVSSSKLPAGTCPTCGKIYCRSCAQINEVEEYLCSTDGDVLKENILGLIKG